MYDPLSAFCKAWKLKLAYAAPKLTFSIATSLLPLNHCTIPLGFPRSLSWVISQIIETLVPLLTLNTSFAL